MTNHPPVSEAVKEMATPAPPDQIVVAERCTECDWHLTLRGDPVRPGVVLICPNCLHRVRKPRSPTQWEGGVFRGP